MDFRLSFFSLVTVLWLLPSSYAITCYQETMYGASATLPDDAATASGCDYCSTTRFTVAINGPVGAFIRTVWSCERGKNNQLLMKSCGGQQDNNGQGRAGGCSFGNGADDQNAMEEQCVDMLYAFHSPEGLPQTSCKCCTDYCNRDLKCAIDIKERVEEGDEDCEDDGGTFSRRELPDPPRNGPPAYPPRPPMPTRPTFPAQQQSNNNDNVPMEVSGLGQCAPAVIDLAELCYSLMSTDSSETMNHQQQMMGMGGHPQPPSGWP